MAFDKLKVILSPNVARYLGYYFNVFELKKEIHASLYLEFSSKPENRK